MRTARRDGIASAPAETTLGSRHFAGPVGAHVLEAARGDVVGDEVVRHYREPRASQDGGGMAGVVFRSSCCAGSRLKTANNDQAGRVCAVGCSSVAEARGRQRYSKANARAIA